MEGEKLETRRRYRVKEVVDILGISKRTLYRYEKIGIFPQSRRNPINKWREYASEDIQHLMQIMGR